MKKKTRASKIKSRSAVFVVMCLGGIIAFILIVVIPYQKKLEAMDIQIKDLRNEKAKQEEYIPLFKDIITKVKIEMPGSLPSPDPEKLNSSEAAHLKSYFQKIADENRFLLESINPDMDSLTENTRYLKVKLSLKGKFSAFQDVLTDLGRLPFFESIEQAQIKGDLDTAKINLVVLLIKGF